MGASGGNPVLKSLDQAQTQLYHFKAVLIAGLGFFTDAYDLFTIGLLTKLLGRIYYYDSTVKAPGKLPSHVYAAVLGTALCGTLAGQLFFGMLGDKFGRKKVYGHTLILMVIASLGQGLSIGRSPKAVISTLCFFRFWLGFGIGGDYPLSATIMSEYANVKTRGSFVAAVFAMQGIGFLTGATVTIIITAIFDHKDHRNAFKDYGYLRPQDSSTSPEAQWVWRLVLMFGAVPALMTYYSRSRMPETARYTALIQRNQPKAAADMAKVLHTEFDVDGAMSGRAKAQNEATDFGLFTRQFARRHGIEIIGTSLTWFLLDVTYYSQNLLQSQIFSAVKWVPTAISMSALEETHRVARAQAIIALCGTVPGYWFTVFFIDRVGRKPIQLMGFFMTSVFMLALSLDFYNLRRRKHTTFITLYALTFFFANFGPNATTFIIPAELFPARLRSTCHGISAAFGKLGSIVGTFTFLYLSPDRRIPSSYGGGYKPSLGFKWSFFILAMCSLMGFFVTIVCIPETKGRSLENMSGEDSDDNAIADANSGVKGDNGATVGDVDKEVSR